jgi:hypothetical protein
MHPAHNEEGVGWWCWWGYESKLVCFEFDICRINGSDYFVSLLRGETPHRGHPPQLCLYPQFFFSLKIEGLSTKLMFLRFKAYLHPPGRLLLHNAIWNSVVNWNFPPGMTVEKWGGKLNSPLFSFRTFVVPNFAPLFQGVKISSYQSSARWATSIKVIRRSVTVVQRFFLTLFNWRAIHQHRFSQRTTRSSRCNRTTSTAPSTLKNCDCCWSFVLSVSMLCVWV